jgi:hypothetical protein
MFVLLRAMFVLSNISVTGLQTGHTGGFTCLYLYAALVILFRNWNHQKNIAKFFAESECVELFTCWKATLPTYLVVTPIVGCCLTLVLVQLKLDGYNGISWTTTSVPLWLITIFGSCRQVFHIQYFVGNKTFRKSIALSAAISFIAIPTVLPLTLMSYAYDHFTDPAQYWKYCTIFLLLSTPCCINSVDIPSII